MVCCHSVIVTIHIQGADYNKVGDTEKARTFGSVAIIYDMVMVGIYSVLYILVFIAFVITMAVVFS